jgi:hypothetical protein
VAHATGTLSPTGLLLAQSMIEVPDRFVLTPEGRVALAG